MSKVDVCYIVSHGFASRMIFQTGLLQKIIETGIYYQEFKFGNNYQLSVNISKGIIKVWFDNYDEMCMGSHHEIYHILKLLAVKLPADYIAGFERILIDLIDEKCWLSKTNITEEELNKISEIRNTIIDLKKQIRKIKN